MIFTAHETIIAEHKAGGKGHVTIMPVIDSALYRGQNQMFARVTLEKGCSIGYHQHQGNSETYFILSGEGLYNDNGKETTVHAGDTTFCGDGEWHGIENKGDMPLIFMALIANSPKA